MTQKVRQEDGLEGLLVSILGILIILGGTTAIYFWIARSVPDDVGSIEWKKDQLSKWIWLVFGTFFFIYGVVGAIREKIGVGWRAGFNQVSTILEGVGAFTAGIGTTIGGLLMLVTAAIYFYPSLGAIFHPFATLICGFVSIILSWICGAIYRHWVIERNGQQCVVAYLDSVQAQRYHPLRG
jgi:hypothetical protein